MTARTKGEIETPRIGGHTNASATLYLLLTIAEQNLGQTNCLSDKVVWVYLLSRVAATGPSDGIKS